MFKIPITTSEQILIAAQKLVRKVTHPFLGSEIEDLLDEAAMIRERLEKSDDVLQSDESKFNQLILQLNRSVHEADFKVMKLKGDLESVGRCFGVGDAAHFLAIHPEIEELEMTNIILNTTDYRLKFFYAALADIKKLRKMTLFNFVPTERFFKALQSIRIEHLDFRDLAMDPLAPFEAFDAWIPPFIKSNPPLKKLSIFVDHFFFRMVYPLANILEALALNTRLEVCLF